ncbi:MAG: hypothetical protein MZV70_41920 [Desulfobacterales bacterium]|nr:hypothetical protein [Desulfobacterales bacterium]
MRSTASGWKTIPRAQPAAAAAQARRHFPGLQADPRPQRLRKRRPGAGGRRPSAGADSQEECNSVLAMVGMEHHAGALPHPAVRRRAAAGGRGPGGGRRPQDHPRRRADGQPGRGLRAGGDGPAAGRLHPRSDGRHRHP